VVVSRAWTRRSVLAVLMWGYASVALVGAMAWVIVSRTNSGWNVCGIPPARSGPLLPQLVVVGLCLLGFGVGHVFARLEPEPTQPTDRAQLLARLVQSRTLVQTTIVVLLMLGAVGLLAYETVALQNPHSLVAITYYVRCANVAHNYRTVAAAAGVCMVVGRWFRFPWWGV
jgi:hypothetical protein